MYYEIKLLEHMFFMQRYKMVSKLDEMFH